MFACLFPDLNDKKNSRCGLRLLDPADYAKLSLYYHAGLKKRVELELT